MRSQVKVPHEKLDSCCGDEIFKFPFPSNGGKRACCGTRTFNTDLLAQFENNFMENLKIQSIILKWQNEKKIQIVFLEDREVI